MVIITHLNFVHYIIARSFLFIPSVVVNVLSFPLAMQLTDYPS